MAERPNGGLTAPPEPEGERKILTALFADIKGSTQLEEDLDPEEARAIIDPALQVMIDVVRRYDGYVVQSTGDGVFALFGAPLAHEDHPQRALHAALRMQEQLRRYAAVLDGQGRAPIEIRVGVNTGEVVVRTIRTGAARTEYTPIGHTANLASRLQAIAGPGAVVVSENTRRLVEGYFQLKALGPIRVKGLSEAVPAYEVTGAGPLRTRLQRAAGRGLTKFVGRERETAEAGRALEAARAGQGQIVAVVGEAGVGKSRLFHEIKGTLGPGCRILETFAVAHGTGSSYLPVIELLRNYFNIESEDDESSRREKVSARVLALDRSLEDTLPYLMALMGLVPSGDALLEMDAEIRKRRTLDAVRRILIRESLNQTLIVIFEDLHWIDDETQALLNLLADSIADAKILQLVNYRPGYLHAWGNKTYYTELRLKPLGSESADNMLASLLGAGRDLAPLKRLIIERTQGNPFFMEEMVLALFEQGLIVRDGAVKLTKPISDIRVPATVQGILAARIDRLPADQKDLLQTLAVLGREFPLGLVRKVTRKSEEESTLLLGELQVAEFIYEQPALGDAEYSFKHALTQEVAYGSMLIERRRILHEHAGAAIEALFGNRIDDHLNDLANHYSHSANSTKAVEYLHRAGAASAARSAYGDAIRYLTAGLDRIGTLADSQKRTYSELDLRLAMLQAVQPLKGAAAPEVGELLTRANELCGRVADDWKLFTVLFGLRLFHSGSRPRIALEYARQMLTLAERKHDPAMAVAANYAAGRCLLDLAEFTQALTHFKAAIAVSTDLHPDMPSFWGDPWVLARSLAALALWHLGYPDQARARSREAIALARELGRPSTIVLALGNDAQLKQLLRDVHGALGGADEVAKLAEQIGFLGPTFFSPLYRGWAMVESGQIQDGMMEMQRNANARAAATARGTLDIFLAQAYGRIGRADEGLEVLDRWLLERGEIGARIYEAWTYCVAGELLLLRDPPDVIEAEHRFRTAIDIARAQQAKSWELGAATRLARLLASQDRSDEARRLLSEILDWFTEGFDTADLKAARAVLDQLSSPLGAPALHPDRTRPN